MTRTRSLTLIAIVAVLSLVVAACDSGDAELSTTSSLVSGGGGDGGNGGSDNGESTTTIAADGSDSNTSTTLRGSSVDSFEVIAREPGSDGETLYIVIPQAAYTDVDLENFVGDLLESGTATWGAEIFDDILALEAYRLDEADRTEEQVELISRHHFVSLINGDTLRFQGPFESSGEMVIGS